MLIQRRRLSQSIMASTAALALPGKVKAASDQPARGGTLHWGYYPEPSAIHGGIIAANKRVKNFASTADGLSNSFADLSLQPHARE